MSVMTRSVLVFGRRMPLAAILAAVVVLAAILSLIVALSGQRHAPGPSRQAVTAALGPSSASVPSSSVPSSSAPSSVSAAPSSPRSSARHASRGPGRHTPGPNAGVPVIGPHASLPPGDGHLALSPSDPVHLRIPAIGVSSGMLRLGLNADHSVEVPPLSQVATPGWYKYSAPPGVPGSTVVLGHVDSAAAPGVFFRLSSLRPGDEVDVTRADGTTAVFRVDAVREFAKSAFPARLIYYPTRYPSLKLVTCGGRFDASSGNYLDNIVAFATLVDVHH